MPNIKDVGTEKNSLDSGFFAAYTLKLMKDNGGNFENLEMEQAKVYAQRDAFSKGKFANSGKAGHKWLDEVGAVDFVKHLGLDHYDGEFTLTMFRENKKTANYLVESLARKGAHGIMVLGKGTLAHWVSILGHDGDKLYVYDPRRIDQPRATWVETDTFVEALRKNVCAAVIAPNLTSAHAVVADSSEMVMTFFQQADPDLVGHPGKNLDHPGQESVLPLEEGAAEVLGAGGGDGSAQDVSRELENNWEIHQDKGDSDCGPSCAAFLRYGGSRSKDSPKEGDHPVTIDTIQKLCGMMRRETSASLAADEHGQFTDGIDDDTKVQVHDEFAGLAKVYVGGKLKPKENPRPVRHKKVYKAFKAGSSLGDGKAWIPGIQIIGHLQDLADHDARRGGIGVGIVASTGYTEWPKKGEPEMKWNYATYHAVVFMDCGHFQENSGKETFTPLVFTKDDEGTYDTDQAAFDSAWVRYFNPGYSSDSTPKAGPDRMQASLFAFLHACRYQEGFLYEDPLFFQDEKDKKYANSGAVYALAAPDEWYIKKGDVLGELYLTAEPFKRVPIVATSDAEYYDNATQADAAANNCETGALVVESPPGTFSFVSIKDADVENQNKGWLEQALSAVLPDAAVQVAQTDDSDRSWARSEDEFLCRNWNYLASIRGWLGVTVGGKKEHRKIDTIWQYSHRPDVPNKVLLPSPFSWR